jgi:hypothetical protein
MDFMRTYVVLGHAMAKRSIVALAASLLTLTACQGVPAGFGSTRPQAQQNADSLFTSLVNRFTNVTRSPRYERARELIGRHALTPSVIYNDTTIWTAITNDGTRTLFADASFNDGRYTFANVPASAPLKSLADGRHIMRLKKVGDNQYEWSTAVDFAIGQLTAQDVGNVITQWLASAEGRSAATLRSEYAHAFPRTTTELGRLFTIDTLISVQDKYGGNTVYIGFHMTPNGIRQALPKYAAYLDKYILKLKFRFTLTDKQGATWFDMAGNAGKITMRIRSHNGHFAPLEGPIRPIPDTLILRTDATVKVKVFTVGAHKLIGEWVNVQSSHERGWAMRFTREPDWQLPPVVGHLIRTPLKRPFKGPGTQFRITIRDNPGQQTLISRRLSTTVEESAILRFLGKLGGDAMGDFVAEAEAEENRFNATLFTAMRADINALLK